MPETKYDKYGRYVEDDGNIETPEDATLAERIADVLRMDDRWQWKETINICGYTIFELLREAHAVLNEKELESKLRSSGALISIKNGKPALLPGQSREAIPLSFSAIKPLLRKKIIVKFADHRPQANVRYYFIPDYP